MNIELRLLDSNGSEVKVLPDYESVQLSPVDMDYGAMQFTYPVNGKNIELIRDADEFELAVYLDGVKVPELGGLFQEVEDDDVAESGIVTFHGTGYLTMLDEGRVFPQGWPTYDPLNPKKKFLDDTAGVIMKTLITEAQSRGALPGIGTSTFTGTTDSNGQAWTKQITLEFTPGIKITEVLKSLVGNGMVEFKMVGKDLRMYNPGTMSVDRTTQNPPVTLRRGRDIRDSPRKKSSRDRATVILAAGKEDEGIYHEEVDTVAVANWRRIEGYISNGSVSDAGTLNAYAELELQKSSQPRMEKTHGLEFADPKSPQPIRDFQVGDWVFSDVGRGTERLRIKQFVLERSSDGKYSGSVVLNDLFAERTEQLMRRIEGIVGGSTITGESRAEDVPTDPVADRLAPKAPTSLVVSSLAYGATDGLTWAQVTATWDAVTQNTDGTVLEDLEGYRVSWRYSLSDSWHYIEERDGTTVSWDGLEPNREVEVWVQAYDRVGNGSAWLGPEFITTESDDVPPAQPITPVVDNYLGLLRIFWNGLLSGNTEPPADFHGLEVHVSTVNNFTPSDSTLIDFLSSRGYAFHKSTYGTTMYVKFVAVDRLGNRSTVSSQASGSTSGIVNQDLIDGAIQTAKLADLAVTTAKLTDGAVGSAKLADLAVTTAKIANLAVGTAQMADLSVAQAKIALLAVGTAQIADLAVTNGKIENLNVGKLVSGTMSADVTVSGRMTTSTGTGQRTEMVPSGINSYNASNQQTVRLNGTSNLLTGVFKTSDTGRRIEMGTTGSGGRIDFWSPSGKNAFVQAWTENQATEVEAIQFGIEVPGAGALWNRINYNTSVNGEYATYRTGTHEFSYDVSAATKDLNGNPNGGAFLVFQTNDKSNQATDGGILEGLRFQIIKDETNLYFQDIVRVKLDGTGFNTYHTDAGQTLSVNGSDFTYWDNSRQRFRIDSGGMLYTGNNGQQRLQVAEATATGLVYREPSGATRLWVKDDSFIYWDNSDRQRMTIGNGGTDGSGNPLSTFYLRGADNLVDLDFYPNWMRFFPNQSASWEGFVEFWGNGNDGQSPRIKLWSNNIGTGGVWAVCIKNNQGHLEIRNIDDTGWADIHTGAINTNSNQIVAGNIFQNGSQVSSDMSLKADIRTAEKGALEKVRKTRVTSYRRKGKKDAPRELGLIAQEVPEEVRGLDHPTDGTKTVDLYAMAAMDWAATQELAEIVQAQGKELAELRTQLREALGI